MDDQKYLEWINFYSAFANGLLKYESDRATLLDKLQKVFTELKIKFQKLEEDDSILDIDPFTVFGLFNKGITHSNRVSIIRGLAKEFGLDKISVPQSFDGIPVLNNLKAVFFGWNRNSNDIDNLWLLFKTAINYADCKTDKTETRNAFIKVYNIVIQQSCIKWNITMGLYWIRPHTFLNLDSRSRWYITNYCPEIIFFNEKSIKSVPDGEQYLSLCDMANRQLQKGKYNFNNIPELSYQAWLISEQVNQENKKLEENSAIVDEDTNAVHYWLYSPGKNAGYWEEFYKKGIMAIGWGAIGNLSKFEDKNQMKETMRTTYEHSDRSYKNDAHAAWQFAKEIKVGDVVFVKQGMHQIIGRGVVESEYLFDENQPEDFNNVRRVKWTHKGEWEHPGQAVLKTLTDITPYTDYIEKLNALFAEENEDEIENRTIVYPPYTADDFLREVYMSENDYNTLVDIVHEKKNVILQGAPGVGKTYAAKRLAYSMMGVQDSERVMMIQFHQSYSYEDFIMGYRPTETGGFKLNEGPFYKFCKLAEGDSENDYFFIIDEINRGNLSKIFGELFMLVEKDKRSKVKLQLLYSNEKFAVPDNVYIIGMMNTADRSLALLDYALRRRFAFFEMQPGFNTEGFIQYRTELNNPKFDKLIDAIETLNAAINADTTLGEGFRIGHSYFCNVKQNTHLSNIVEYEIIHLLKEYWFDEPTKVRDWSAVLRSAIQ